MGRSGSSADGLKLMLVREVSDLKGQRRELNKQLEELKEELEETKDHCNAIWALARDFLPLCPIKHQKMWLVAMEEGKKLKCEGKNKLAALQKINDELAEVIARISDMTDEEDIAKLCQESLEKYVKEKNG